MSENDGQSPAPQAEEQAAEQMEAGDETQVNGGDEGQQQETSGQAVEGEQEAGEQAEAQEAGGEQGQQEDAEDGQQVAEEGQGQEAEEPAEGEGGEQAEQPAEGEQAEKPAEDTEQVESGEQADQGRQEESGEQAEKPAEVDQAEEGEQADSGEQAEGEQVESGEQTEAPEGEQVESGEQTEAPAGEQAESGEQTEAPEGEQVESGEQTEAPEGEQVESGEQTEAPEGEQAESGEQAEATEGEQAESGEQTEAPEGEQVESGEQAEAPEGEQAESGEQAEAPEGEQVESGEQAEAPEGEQAESGEQAEAPEGEQAESGEQTEAPEGEQAESGEQAEAPEVEQAESVEQAAEGEQTEGEQAEQGVEEPKADGEQEVPAEQEAAGTDQVEEAQQTEGDAEAAQEVQGEPAAEAAQEEKPASPAAAKDDAASGTEPVQDLPEVDPHAETPRMTVDLESTATVKFVLMPSGQVATLACTLGQTLGQLKDHFASELKMSASVLLLMLEGRNMSNETILADLGVSPNGTIQLELQSRDPVGAPLKQYRPRQEYHMPDVISVKVQGDEGEYKDIVVEIERSVRKKPYLGGYRHKKTNIEYHHASAQTMSKPRPTNLAERNCRDTQTVQQRHRVQQTTNDMSTQMTKIGVYVSNMEDKLVIPGKYITADAHKAKQLANIITIQKYYRRWLAIRNVEKIRDDRDQRLEWEKEEELRKKKEKEERIKREFERRMNPKTKEDFDLLYHALEKWRQEELDHINLTLSGAERKAALCQLLEQETQLIGSIGRHKLEADNENKQKNIQSFLNKAAAPKRWRGPDGKVTEMDTPFTIRAQELRDIYATTNMRYLTQDERLDVLLTLKHTVKEHDCKLTQEIIELIDREADLLMRGVKESNLEGLRKRISTLFLQYIKTPMFNPEVTNLLKVPQDPSILRKDIYFCTSCNQYLPSTDFQLSSNARSVGKCAKCNKKDNDGRVRQDYSHYQYMIKALRKSEESFEDGSKIAFLLQENDLRYLVENVWSSQSVLSAWDDLYDLVLVRWDKNEEWSPWNCILLTKEEASAHNKLENLEEGYGKVFMHKVDHKHTLAKNYFARLPGMAQLMQTREPRNPSSRMPTISGKKLPVQASA